MSSPPPVPSRHPVGLVQIGAVMLVLLASGAVAVRLLRRPEEPVHVVLLVLDTLRADRVNGTGPHPDACPTLTALAEESVVFDHARAAAPWTLPSHASLFTGLPPSRHGCTFETFRLDESVPTLADVLKTQEGFQTYGITSNVNVSTRQGLQRGFELFEEVWTLREQERGLDDSAIVVERFRRWLAGRDSSRPSFAFLNLMDVHLPYTPAPPFDRLYGEVDEDVRALAADGALLHRVLRGEVTLDPRVRDGLAKLYDGELRILDQHVAQILRAIEDEGHAGHTWVIVTSDHGEMLGEAGLVDHQLTLREEVLRVPLLVRPPARQGISPVHVAEPVSLLQVFTWVRDMAAGRPPLWIPAPDRPPVELGAEYARPVELVEFLESEHLDASAHDRRQVAVVSQEPEGYYKLLIDSKDQISLHDLRADDPDDHSVADELPVLRDRLSDRVSSDPLRWRFLHASSEGTMPIFSPREREELVRLGYLRESAGTVIQGAGARLLLLAVRAREAGNLEEARQRLEKALQFDPHHPDLLHAAAELATTMGREDAATLWQRFLDAAEPDDPRTEAARLQLSKSAEGGER